MRIRVLTLVLVAATALAVACSSSEPAAAPTEPSPTQTASASPSPTSESAPTPLAEAAPTATAIPPSPTSPPTEPTATQEPVPTPTPAIAEGSVVLRIVDGSQASYAIREQLARQSLPNDAVGVTSDVTGSIVFGPDGEIDSVNSILIVDLTTLKSDESRRDGYVRTNTLQTRRYPTAEFVPTGVEGLRWPLPAEGQFDFQLIGETMIHGVVKPLTWDVTATFTESQVVGTATVTFTFDTFNMSKPRLSFILSVEDDIQLSIDFVLERQG